MNFLDDVTQEDAWSDWYASRETVRMPVVTVSPKLVEININYVNQVVQIYAAQDGLSEESFLGKLVLKEQYERCQLASL